MNLIINSVEAMQRFGHFLAGWLESGAVVALTGDLGAGKTTLSQSIAAGLGVKEDVTSPTFALMNVYSTTSGMEVYHFDVYRILDPSEMEDIGFDDFVYGKGVSLIEWAGMIEPMVPETALWIEIGYGFEAEERYLRLSSPSIETRAKIKVLIEAFKGEVDCS
ncbi:tRNA (adenosine(37)-N6)-threonylcarbamoyltransferase complex ATPase subunit type 1 TsaE [Acidaminobacter sp.]|uniref:tRNA (adenosine(37)-N6)-threonylcarbamoyltransferase complex ATPase subunit type 1 TsaE n=1 Tax=Acidaminobacter sp. TaxID=1872102 RepID=UPI00255F8F2F|nr:tRNA (adenosine(37)-N6)-threonylcarbamoyltransferase complex ATPase subunit type 1 TsaE [Acidaminobacter sp.]MDK9711887.1 tRNA (adenosine(37)-N6)-threonylcarbamoyltransferase complex ATPase subunit type 1 TsaE [Acidaminobacter sp.]